MLLYDALCARVGAERVRTGHRLAAFEQRGDRVRASFIDKDTGAPVGAFDADVLIAADGIHSVVRAHFYPDEGPPKWNGVQMWRHRRRALSLEPLADLVWNEPSKVRLLSDLEAASRAWTRADQLDLRPRARCERVAAQG
jgi:2-polyprenyl-6-methoxyphenol hydroxylase-like FAD-dependent oxidoreductase